MCVLLPCQLSSLELGVQKQGDGNKCLCTRWRIHRLETTPMKACTDAAGTVQEKRQKLPSKDLERQESSGGNAPAASNAEVWKYEAIKTNGNCETRVFWTVRGCLQQINKPRA